MNTNLNPHVFSFESFSVLQELTIVFSVLHCIIYPAMVLLLVTAMCELNFYCAEERNEGGVEWGGR